MAIAETPDAPADHVAAATTDDPSRTPHCRWWAGVLFGLVGMLALLLASFPARNTEVAVHLASGRAVLQGDLTAGNLPLTFSVHAGWLYDFLCFGVYSALGGAALVAVKALAIAAMALMLLSLGRTRGWWIPAALTALALLTMGTRMALQPATFACVLFAIIVFVLWRRDNSQATAPAALVTFWPLLLLFAIWTNLSGGWSVGLVAVACYGLGRLMEGGAPGRCRWRSFFLGAGGWIALAGACLLNPRFWQSFDWLSDDWLSELRWLGISAVQLDGERIVSPFSPTYWTAFGQSPVGLAYFPLLGLSLFSFLLNVRRWRWRWFLPWAALASLSALQSRVMPFFAVLAAPAAAWNFQEFFAAHAEDPRRWWSRGLAAALGAAFVICAWPGWLQLPPYGPRSWAIEWSPSLLRSAETCRQWHEQGKLTAATKGLHLSRETTHLFGWLCPQAKGVWDPALSDALLGLARPPEDFLQLLRDAGIHHVIVHDPNPDRGRLFAALNVLGADPKQWPLLHLEGDVAIFGWHDPARSEPADPFAGWELDLEHLALHPPPDKLAPRQPAPDARHWSDAFWKPAPPRSVARDEATIYLLRAESMRLTALWRHLFDWEATQIAALTAAAPGWTAATCLRDLPVRLELYQHTLTRDAEKTASRIGFSQWVLAAQRSFAFQRDDSPPEILFLAIRAARRALLDNPHDANAQLILGDCYLRLMHHTRERAWGQRLHELIRLRQAQASEALNQAVLLKPDLLQAHLKLSGLYFDMGCLDLARQHRRAHFALLRKAGPASVDESAFHVQQLDQFDHELKKLEATVDELERWYAENAAGARVLDRARMAAHKGLMAKARQILTESDVSAFGAQGMALELELLLRTGRAKDVREWTSPDLATALGAGNFHWGRTQAFAAGGDYALAEEELAHLASGGRTEGEVTPRDAIALMVAQQLGLESRLWGSSTAESMPRLAAQSIFWERVGGLAQSMRKEADVNVLLGILAMEQGRTEDAAMAFRRALAIWNEAGTGGSFDFDARVIAQAWLSKLK